MISPSNILVLEQFAHTVFIYIHFIIEVSVCVIFCVNCHFQNIICKNYNSFSNFIVLIHKFYPAVFVHPARQQKPAGDTCRKNYLFLGSGNKIRRVHQLFSQCSVMLPPCCWAVVRTLFRSDPCFGKPSASSAGAASV